MKRALAGPAFLLLLFGISSSAYAQPSKPVRGGNSLTFARQVGLHAAFIVVDNLSAHRRSFSGIDAWLDDFTVRTKGLDPKGDPASWPQLDADTLAIHNSKFWRAYYEIRPGDPGAALLYAGLLLGCGEAARARNVIDFQQFGTGMPEGVNNALGRLYSAAMEAGTESKELVEMGTKLFDKGKYPEAIGQYRQALKLWPQNATAYYELAYTLRTQDEVARGERRGGPLADGAWSVSHDAKAQFSAEVKAAYAQCRRYSPFMLKGYQGDVADIGQGAVAIGDKIVPAMKRLAKQPRDEAEINPALYEIARGCQQADIHDLALVVSQILVARRGQYDASDHPFITASLRKLVPGSDTEDALERLAGKTAAFCQVIPMENGIRKPVQPSATTFRLGTPRYINEKDNQGEYSIIVPVEVQKAENFANPGLRLAYVLFRGTIQTPPVELKAVEDKFLINTDKAGNHDVYWQVRSVREGISGEAHAVLNAPQSKVIGNKAVIRYRCRGIPDFDMGLFLLDKMEVGSNVLVFRKKDFVLGDGEAIFQAAVGNLGDSGQTGK